MKISQSQIHGLLQFIAFVILFPLGGLIAYFRSSLGPWWLRTHIIIQSVATLLVFGSVILIKLNHSHSDTDTDSHNKSSDTQQKQQKPIHLHRIVGPIIVVLLIIQWCWALFAKRYMNIDWQRWLSIHMILAVLIVSLGWFQIYLGVQYQNQINTQTETDDIIRELESK